MNKPKFKLFIYFTYIITEYNAKLNYRLRLEITYHSIGLGGKSIQKFL